MPTRNQAHFIRTAVDSVLRQTDAAVDLLQLPKNQERVRHLLATNKPLAN